MPWLSGEGRGARLERSGSGLREPLEGLRDLTCFQTVAGGNGLRGQHGMAWGGGDQKGGKGPGTSEAGNLEPNFVCASGQPPPALSLRFPFI